MDNRLRYLPRRVKQLLLIGFDGLCIPVLLWLAWSLRIERPLGDLRLWGVVSALVFLGSMLIFARCGLYRAVLRYRSEYAWSQILKALAGSASIVLLLGLATAGAVPRSLFAGYFVLALLVLGGARWVAWHILNGKAARSAGIAVAIYGAGSCGRQLMAMLRLSGELRPVVFIDDDPGLHGRLVDGFEVIRATPEAIRSAIARHELREILLAIPSLRASQRRTILEALEPYGLHVKTVPHLKSLLSGALSVNQLQDVSIEDLLGRDPVTPVDGLLRECIRDHTVMVTGGGGSIGSEICRQALQLGARRLVVVDHSEYALYQIGEELRTLAAEGLTKASLRFVLGSVTDRAFLEDLFAVERVNTVYHAAAYKHVPIVETCPFEGVRNNVFGTAEVARTAARFGVNHFVLISTDKAVRPTNVMGASKRLAELVVQGVANRHPAMQCAIVRFGNVLGSSGSVVPLFKQQIQKGGPITLTHEDVTRYFMTIPEAVGLVIQAGALGKEGEVFLLDMGAPVRIKDLAQRMVHLCGLTLRTPDAPDGDIEIRVTGLRPGEKLYEELLVGQKSEETPHPRIFRDEHPQCDGDCAQQVLERLTILMMQRDRAALGEFLAEVVCGYAPAPMLFDQSQIVQQAEPNRPVIRAAA